MTELRLVGRTFTLNLRGGEMAGKKSKRRLLPRGWGKSSRKEEEGGVGSKVADKEESWDRLGYGLATASTYVVKRVRLHSQVARNQVVSR